MPKTSPIKDPFHFHPELRQLIKPFRDSFYRSITTEKIRAQIENSGQELQIDFYEDDVRERLRSEALSRHTGDLYVFGYASLMWDPAIDFSEVRRAFAPNHQRRFILVDDKGGRGTSEKPGLMAALDQGQGCEGLAFKITSEKVDKETEILFRRELIAPGYLAVFVTIEIDGTSQVALTFVADHEQPHIRQDITRLEQIRFAATGTGILGTSLEYLESTVVQLSEIGIIDPDASGLLAAARNYSSPQKAIP